MYKLLSNLLVISDVNWSFIQNTTTFTKYCLSQKISKLPGSFEIHWVTVLLSGFQSPHKVLNSTE